MGYKEFANLREGKNYLDSHNDENFNNEYMYMLNKLFSWYSSIPPGWRRFFLAALVPVQEYVFLEPFRTAVGTAIKSHPDLALELSTIILTGALLTVAVICLFVIEFFSGVASKIRTKPGGYAFLICLFGWIMLPFFFTNLIGYN